MPSHSEGPGIWLSVWRFLLTLLIWASSEGSGETARMRRLAWTFAARIGYKYQIRLTRSKYEQIPSAIVSLTPGIVSQHMVLMHTPLMFNRLNNIGMGILPNLKHLAIKAVNLTREKSQHYQHESLQVWWLTLMSRMVVKLLFLLKYRKFSKYSDTQKICCNHS